jgi:hypothetical protein
MSFQDFGRSTNGGSSSNRVSSSSAGAARYQGGSKTTIPAAPTASSSSSSSAINGSSSSPAAALGQISEALNQYQVRNMKHMRLKLHAMLSVQFCFELHEMTIYNLKERDSQ